MIFRNLIGLLMFSYSTLNENTTDYKPIYRHNNQKKQNEINSHLLNKSQNNQASAKVFSPIF